MNLEKSLIDFLKAGKKLEYDYEKAEPGFVGLCNVDELEEDIIYVEEAYEGALYYEIPAVNITNENEGYDPEFILLWLPNEQVYGTWDCEHWVLYTFENTVWEDIVKNPLPYINCLWDYQQTVGTLFNPKEKYELIKGWPI